ncbi:MAG: hypothetical protein KBS55_04580 [Bacteroidales bacterium]|nr:hypothetical protein [Candidatus Cryptobacteroides aphodequi]
MAKVINPIDSVETMSQAIRQVGIIPFTRSDIPGWSIEELTAPGCWFMDEDAEGVLGPWDWKIEVIAEGDIAYGKFIRNKAAFATAEWYRHLMNWRRSQPRYRIAVEESYPGNTHMDQLYKLFSPTILDAIREMGCVEGSDIRKVMTERTTKEQRSRIKGCLEKYLLPEVKRTAADYLNQYLEMGTWTVVGEFRRVYRGANLEYKGWQRSSITTPENLFGFSADFPCDHPSGHCPAGAGHTTANLATHGLAARPSAKPRPFWDKFFDDAQGQSMPDCTPEESRDAIIDKIRESFPSASPAELLKLI